MAHDPRAQGIGRRAALPLEVEVYRKFNRWDQKFIEGKKQEFPHLVRPPPGVGASGAGSVNWVGLNADPCLAKFKAKQGHVKEMADPLKAKFFAQRGLNVMNAGSKSLPTLSDSFYGKFRTGQHCRDKHLSRCSASLHYLEQKIKCTPLQRDQSTDVQPEQVPVEELLYSGVSRDSEGRSAYLRNRHQMAPQDKAKTPVTASQVVGWRCYRGPGKHVGKQLKPCEPPPSMIYLA